MDIKAVGDLIGVANQSALQWYATMTNKPVQAGAPGSLMRNVFGSDFSGGPSLVGQTAAPVGTLILAAIVVAGVVLIVRR
jgi:hypothetical protein